MLSKDQIKRLQQKGFTLKQIALAYHVNERTIYRWNNYTYKPKQKKGRKPKLNWNREDLKLFLEHVLKDNTKTQQEMADCASVHS